MDQGRKLHLELNAIVRQAVRLEPIAARAVCAGLQSWKLSSTIGTDDESQALVASQPPGEADQDRSADDRNGRSTTFQMAEVAVSRDVFSEILDRISRLRCCTV